MDDMRSICITAVDDLAGFCIAQHLHSQEKFRQKFLLLSGLALRTSSAEAQQLQHDGVRVYQHVPGDGRRLVNDLTVMGCDTICVVPPVHEDKLDLTLELVTAAKTAGVRNLLLISSVGAEYATKEKQPRMREFLEMETAVLSEIGQFGLNHSPCVIRAALCIDHLLQCIIHARNDGFLTLPLGLRHNKFAPVALPSVASLAAHVLTGRGEHGFDDRHFRQMMAVTGPSLFSGEDLAATVTSGSTRECVYQEISEAAAKRLFNFQSRIKQCEMDYILEYFSLVREGKLNYIATTASHYVTSQPD
ncbi:hypothetical protein KVR01_008240 [Diaporthe batatas]|uniref:uncharacterized protein n=1 Tax=Diaporthe batatas TaxID=748121 RepID=UPI001D04C6FA|nr:uncharacterized protein KVR01_008240 [Diaporthe batatas]KAG8162475.1 hypothetical protein KVR01_008240 [Diaporthe batatas]